MKTNIKNLVASLVFLIAGIVFAVPSVSWGDCETEEVMLHNKYLGVCGYTEKSSFTLEKDTYITRIRIWYDTSIGGDTLSASISGTDGYAKTSGKINKEGCYDIWCAAMFNINQILKAGTYTVTADSKAVCYNPSGETTLILYGCEPEDALPDDTVEGITPPNGISVLDVTANPSSAPVYMGNIVSSGGNAGTLSGKMELSVDFPAYNKPVDIWILIGLPDGRFYVADEAGILLNLDESGFLTIASGIAGKKSEKTIILPFATPSANSSAATIPFDPFPANGEWTVYWLIVPESNGDILKALENEKYELGFYSFKVNSQSSEDEILISTTVEPKNEFQYFDYNNSIALTLSDDIVDVPAMLNVSMVKDFNIQPEDASLENVFNISLGEIEDLSGFIDIEIAYDPLKIPNGVNAENFYGAIYLNENTNKWDQVAYRLDTSKNSIIINTDHLSKFATASINQESIDSKSPMARSKPIYWFPSTVYNTDIDKIKQVLNSMDSSGNAGDEVIKGSWEDIGEAFGIANALLTFSDGMVEKLMVNNSLNKLNDAVGNVGLGIALYQLHLKLDSDYNEDRENAVKAFIKDVGNWAIGRWDNPFMKIASLGVFAVDYSLNKFATTAIEGRYDMYVNAYNRYYQKGSTIPTPPFKVRSGVDWFNVFYDIVKKANSSENPKTLIDTEIYNYVDAFWNDAGGMSFAFGEVAPGFTYTGGDNDTLEDKISDNYKAELVNSYFQPIFRRLYTKIRIDNEQNLKNNEMKKVTDILNQVYTINVTVSGVEKVEGLPVKIITMFNQDLWKGVTGKDGKWQMKCTLLGYINAGLPDKVVLSGVGEQGEDLETKFELVDPSKSVEILFDIEDVQNNDCYFKEGMILNQNNGGSVRVNFNGCSKYSPDSQTIQWDIPLCFQLGPNGTIIPDDYCSQSGNGYTQESLTGSWSCNSINLSFTTSGNSKIDPYFMDCMGPCVDVNAKFTGTATISADSNKKLTYTGSGNVSQTYNYTNKCCPRTPDGTVTCEKPF